MTDSLRSRNFVGDGETDLQAMEFDDARGLLAFAMDGRLLVYDLTRGSVNNRRT
jgi:hypothetical protein